LKYQNNYVEILSIMSNTTKNYDILAASLNVLINLMIQQNYFQIYI